MDFVEQRQKRALAVAEFTKNKASLKSSCLLTMPKAEEEIVNDFVKNNAAFECR